MLNMINILVFVLLTVLLLTIGNLVFSIGEIKEKHDEHIFKGDENKKHTSISLVKIVMYALTKLVLFALLINLLMFTFYEKDITDNILAEILLYFVSFQILIESVSLNHMMRLAVKSINKFSIGELDIKDYFEKIMPHAYKCAITGKEKLLWISSFMFNTLTIILSGILYCQNVMTMFAQNIIIYFLIILYIKYQVIKLMKNVAKTDL